jgi:hypothetical protein
MREKSHSAENVLVIIVYMYNPITIRVTTVVNIEEKRKGGNEEKEEGYAEAENEKFYLQQLNKYNGT